MNWEQQLEAIQSLSDNVCLYMRHPGNWYVRVSGVEIGDGHTLTSVGETGHTPKEAVEKTWEGMTSLKHNQFLVINAMRDTRREVRWTGCMWKDIQRIKPCNS